MFLAWKTEKGENCRGGGCQKEGAGKEGDSISICDGSYIV